MFLYMYIIFMFSFAVALLLIKNNKEASQNAEESKEEKTVNKKAAIISIIIFIICFIGFFVWLNYSSRSNVNNYYNNYDYTPVVPDSGIYISFEEFEKLYNGMTYEHCAELIGGHGTLTSSSSIGSSTYSYYKWEGKKPYSSALLTFENNHLCSKTQYGLK